LSSNHQQAREALGARLRELRRTSGLNGKQFAAKLGWYGASRISKLELGQQIPSDQDLVEWTTACNAPEALAELRIKLNAVDTLYTEWRRQLYAGVHVRQREILELESEAAEIREFAAAMVPGMLQTPEYARSLFERFAAQGRVRATIDEAVQLRMQRQEALHTSGRHFHFVLTEAVLRYTIVASDIMLGQLEKLMVASTLRNVKLGIVPFGTLLPADARHGFWMTDDRLVIVETYAGELRLTDPGDIAVYERIFDQMASVSDYGDLARRLLSHVTRTLPPPR
jgi:transcriptional regulator with XRE-family HTH domain